jgi:hypothetical protein
VRDFLDLIESVDAERASVANLFGDAGRSIRTNPLRTREGYLKRLSEAARFIADVYRGRRDPRQLREAMTTSDFPLLFGDVLDRQMLGHYQETPQTYRNIARVRTVPDFREVKRNYVDGAEGVLDSVEMGPQAEYKYANLSEGQYKYSIGKFGRKLALAWETLINDDVDALKDTPARFGRACRRTEEKFATGLFVDTSGPHASLYTVGNKNIINATNCPGYTAVNPPLSISALQQGFYLLSRAVDADGEPIVIEAVELVVPPALEVTARNILNATEVWLNAEFGGTSNAQLHVANWMRQRTRINVNYYLPIIASVANGSTSWFLFASANDGRPALEMGFLRGHEAPEIFIKDPNARRVGGGTVNPLDGDFDTDSVEYKVRHCFGGTRMNPQATVASNGSGA